MTAVQNRPSQQQNLVPFTQFSMDLVSGNLPNYSFIVPNACDDAHNCGLGEADNWLKAHIDPLIKNPLFQNDGLLIISFDESATDDTDRGGQIAADFCRPTVFYVPIRTSTLLSH